MLSTTCSSSSSWAAFFELLWLGKCCQRITMMILCLLKRDFKPISRQVKAAGIIRVCLWSFQGVNSVCPQKFGHPLESSFFNWLISNGEVNWADGWLASATAKPEENSLEYWQAYGTLWLMGNISVPCRYTEICWTPEPRLQMEPWGHTVPSRLVQGLGTKCPSPFLQCRAQSQPLYALFYFDALHAETKGKLLGGFWPVFFHLEVL